VILGELGSLHRTDTIEFGKCKNCGKFFTFGGIPYFRVWKAVILSPISGVSPSSRQRRFLLQSTGPPGSDTQIRRHEAGSFGLESLFRRTNFFGGGTMPQGTIKKIVSEKGFGFIGGEKGDIFFHHSVVEGGDFETLQIGQSVTYDEGHGPKGPRAENVRPTD